MAAYIIVLACSRQGFYIACLCAQPLFCIDCIFYGVCDRHYSTWELASAPMKGATGLLAKCCMSAPLCTCKKRGGTKQRYCVCVGKSSATFVQPCAVWFTACGRFLRQVLVCGRLSCRLEHAGFLSCHVRFFSFLIIDPYDRHGSCRCCRQCFFV